MPNIDIPIMDFVDQAPEHSQKVSDLLNKMLLVFNKERDSRIRRDAVIAMGGFLMVDVATHATLSKKQKRHNFHIFSESFDGCLEQLWKQHFEGEDLWLKM